MSDTHNHIVNTRWALSVFEKQGVEQILHCGDITTPAVIEIMIGYPVKLAMGNMDYGEDGLYLAAKQRLGSDALADSHSLILNGIHIAFCHGHINRQLGQFIYNGQYQYVFHGHTHVRRDVHLGSARVINPGALGGKHPETRSVCVLDINTGQAEFIILPE